MKRNGPLFLIGLGIACLIVFYLWQTLIYQSQSREIVLIQPIKREVFTAPKPIRRSWRSFFMASGTVSGISLPSGGNGAYTDNGTVNGKESVTNGDWVIQWTGSIWESRKLVIPGIGQNFTHASSGSTIPTTGWSATGSGVGTMVYTPDSVTNTRRSFIVN